jgi:hypothetical protein
MKLFEFDNIDLGGHYDPSADKINTRNITDTRKSKLTLRDLNKLKKLRALRRLEALKQQDVLAVIYGAPSGDGDDGGGDLM